MDRADIMGKFNVERYLSAYGLCINSAYRRRGIATEMLRARVPYLKAFGLKVTATAFTGTGSQKAAALGKSILFHLEL
jgi:RimJ/RimL family protein N-acetyltransferase